MQQKQLQAIPFLALSTVFTFELHFYRDWNTYSTVVRSFSCSAWAFERPVPLLCSW